MSNIAEIANAIGSSASILHYAQIVAEKALLRNLIRTTTNIANRSYEPGEEPDSLLDDAERMILEISQKKTRDNLEPIANVIEDAIERLEIYTKEKYLTSLTGFKS